MCLHARSFMLPSIKPMWDPRYPTTKVSAKVARKTIILRRLCKRYNTFCTYFAFQPF